MSLRQLDSSPDYRVAAWRCASSSSPLAAPPRRFPAEASCGRSLRGNASGSVRLPRVPARRHGLRRALRSSGPWVWPSSRLSPRLRPARQLSSAGTGRPAGSGKRSRPPPLRGGRNGAPLHLLCSPSAGPLHERAPSLSTGPVGGCPGNRAVVPSRPRLPPEPLWLPPARPAGPGVPSLVLFGAAILGAPLVLLGASIGLLGPAVVWAACGLLGAPVLRAPRGLRSASRALRLGPSVRCPCWCGSFDILGAAIVVLCPAGVGGPGQLPDSAVSVPGAPKRPSAWAVVLFGAAVVLVRRSQELPPAGAVPVRSAAVRFSSLLDAEAPRRVLFRRACLLQQCSCPRRSSRRSSRRSTSERRCCDVPASP